MRPEWELTDEEIRNHLWDFLGDSTDTETMCMAHRIRDAQKSKMIAALRAEGVRCYFKNSPIDLWIAASDLAQKLKPNIKGFLVFIEDDEVKGGDKPRSSS